MNRTIFKYLPILMIALSLSAVRAEAGEASAAPADCDNEIRLLREELDNLNAIVKFHGIKNRHRVILRYTALAIEPIKGYSHPGWWPGGAGVHLFDAKLTVNVNAAVSPYVGISSGIMGVTSPGNESTIGGIIVLLNAGVEKGYFRKNNTMLTHSFGAHTGMVGFWAAWPLAGAHAMTELAFKHGRFSTYVNAGIRYSCVFYDDDRLINMLSLPVGAGVLLRI